MKTHHFSKQMPRIITVCLSVLMLVATFFLMDHVRGMLDSDTAISMKEIVSQNKDAITSKLTLEINNVSLIGTQVAETLKNENEITNEKLSQTFRNLNLDGSDTGTTFIAGSDGSAYFHNDDTVNIAGRSYFKLSMAGESNISDRLISRRDGDEVFMISVPIIIRDNVIGSMQKSFTTQEMYDLCSMTLFSNKGYMNIVNSDGYILVSSQRNEYSQEMTNYYRQLYAEGNKKASIQLENDIKHDVSGFMELNEDGEKMFSAYTPIEGIHDWFLITTVANAAVSPNGNMVIDLFYVILMSVIIFFTSLMLYFFYYKRKQQANLERVAFVDEVTNGDSYTKFRIRVHELFEQYPKKAFYILAFDIDNFRYINNYYGYDFGDRVLAHIYQTIQERLSSMELISRMASDHYVLLLEDVSNQRADELMASVDSEDGLILYLSAGLYKVHDRGENLSAMVDKAGTAARTMKGSIYKHVETYSSKYDEQMIQREHMKRNIRQALEDHEIVPYYQPKVDITTNTLSGAEALARWRKPDGTLIPPDEFIPICEATGLIIDLDLCIYEAVLAYLRKLLDEGIPCVPISVNLSRMHLFDKHTIQTLVRLLKQYEIPEHLIEIELTESAFFENMQMITEFIAQLHEQGFCVSMDDFGSGYSSLNMLMDVPIDVLKIDRAFLMETTNSEKQQVIFSTIAQMAKKLNIDVIVEGVETQENIEMMKAVGFQFAQGYFYSRPVNEEAFENLCREGLPCGEK